MVFRGKGVGGAVFRGRNFQTLEMCEMVFRSENFQTLEIYTIVCELVFRGKNFQTLEIYTIVCEMVFRGQNAFQNKLSSTSRSIKTASQLTLTVSIIVVFYTSQITLFNNQTINYMTYALSNCKLAQFYA